MKYFIYSILFFSTSVLAFSNENIEPKVLVLIVASDDLPVYIKEQEIWRSYMHRDREHFEVYFIKVDSELQSDYELSFDVIWSKVENNVSTGMVHRTLLSIEALMPRIEEFDYVLRTNLSSFYVFPRLLKFINTLPRNNCYCGVIGHAGVPFVSGAGFLLSRDLVKKMVSEKESLLAPSPVYEEDLIIGKFFYDRNIDMIPASRINFLTLSDWMDGKDSIPENIFHFRTKNLDAERRLHDEIFIQRELLNMFYLWDCLSPKSAFLQHNSKDEKRHHTTHISSLYLPI